VTLEETSTEMLDADLAVSLRALFLTIRGSLDLLKAAGAEHGKAVVVNISSVLARTAVPGATVYSAAKAGVHALTESLQTELAPHGIQCTTFVPGAVATPLTVWLQDAGVSFDEMVRPEDFAEGLRFLLRTSPTCLVREIEFVPPTQATIGPRVEAYFASRGR
jgi:NAD(P)-dependent dehydrogenase (short-subunit alcohol dehydrogenase family)